MFRYLRYSLVMVAVGFVVKPEAVHAKGQSNDKASLHTIFGPDVLASNINAVRRRTSQLSLEEKYAFLKSWVLPTADYPGFRLVGEFTPTNPSLRARDLEPHRFPSTQGGDLVSPVFDLLDVASQLNRLDDLSAEVAALVEGQEGVDTRAKLVCLALIRLAQERPDEAAELVTQLHRRLIEAFDDKDSDYSAELLLLYDAISRKRALDFVSDLLVAFHDKRFAFDIPDEWESHLGTLVGYYRDQSDVGRELENQDNGSFPRWTPVSRSIAMTRGNGYPEAVWHRPSNGELHLRSGHHRDYLFFTSPLAGEYEVSGEIDIGGRTQIMVGGWFVSPHGGRSSIELGKFRSEHLVQPVDPPFAPNDPWLRHSHRAGTLGPQRRSHHDDLHARLEPWWAWSPQPRGRTDSPTR